jgi:oligopeptidase A
MTHLSTLPAFSQVNLTTIGGELEKLLNANRAQLKTLLEKNTNYSWNNVLQPLEDMDSAIQKLWTPVSHLHSVADSEAVRGVYNTGLMALSDYQMEIMQNEALYHAVDTIKQSAAFAQLSQAQRKIIDNMLRDFKLAGVHLPATEKKRFADLNQQLAKLSTKFQENVLDATQGWHKHITNETDLAGLPALAIAAAKQAAEQKELTGWLFTLEMPSYLAVMTYADSAELRREMYFAYNTRASDQGPNAKQWDNTPVMQDILQTRLEMAQLLGFKNYAEYSLATKMAKTPHQVLDFLQELADASLAQAHQDFAELKDFTDQHHRIDRLNAWDIAYYSEKLRQHAYAVSKEEFRPYFPADHVVTGLFTILNRLYGMTFTRVENPDVWDKHVSLFSITDEQQTLRGYLYLDLFARQGKRDGAWMTDAYARRKLANGDIELPTGFVTCNFNAPVGNDPALLTHDDVNTLFHECGHAVQHLFTTVDYAGVSGINGIPWDAVEIASQFMENWCWEQQGVALIAKHYQTGAALPDTLFQKLIRAKNFQSAMQMVRQLQFALFDFRLHVEYDPKQSQQTQTILNEVRDQLAVFVTPEWNRFQHSFSHIFGGGYAAGYYSYKWAEVLACDAFSLFEERGIFDHSTGTAFLRTLLEQGGAREPMELFVEFRGREPRVDALLRHNGIVKVFA